MLVADYQWVDVMRFGNGCNAATEGYSWGFTTDCGDEYVQMGRPELASCNISDPPAKIGYGCWFFFADPRLQNYSYGSDFKVKNPSGVQVNVGKSLRVDSRVDASRELNLSCADPPMCHEPNTVQDKLYCERAVAMGYDSIQFARPHLPCLVEQCLSGPPGWTSELVMCTGGCMTQPVPGACPPPGVKLKRSDDSGPCTCSNNSDALNCGAGAKLYGRFDDGNQTCAGGITHPEMFELVNNQLLDSKQIKNGRMQERDVILKLLVAENKSTAEWQKAVDFYKEVDQNATVKGQEAFKLSQYAANLERTMNYQNLTSGPDKDKADEQLQQAKLAAKRASEEFRETVHNATTASQAAAQIASDAELWQDTPDDLWQQVNLLQRLTSQVKSGWTNLFTAELGLRDKLGRRDSTLLARHTWSASRIVKLKF